MLNIRPIGYIVGILVVILGVSMILPLIIDIYFKDEHWKIFGYSSFITITSGALLIFSCSNSFPTNFSIQQTFLLTISIWLVLPIFGSIPFGLLITKIFIKKDVRKIGSGNIGATNVLRTGKKSLAILTLLLDIFKGYISVFIAILFFKDLVHIHLLYQKVN